MAGVLTIAKKEFVDQVSDRTFLLCFTILLIVMSGSAFYQVQTISTSSNQPAWLFYAPDFLYLYVATQISSLGALLAVAISITSIQKERTEGSLKVLLSYPIHRDEIILGKLLSGVLVLVLVVIASTAISFGIMAYYLSIPLTTEFLLRVAAFTAMGIVLLTFFLCLGTAVSIVSRSTAASLMVLLIVVFLLRGETLFTALIILNMIIPSVANTFQWYQGGSVMFTTSWYSFFRPYAVVSPVEAYHHFSEIIFTFKPSWGSSTILSFEGQFFKGLDLVTAMLVFAVGAFVACYLLFVRRDVS